MAVNKIDLNNLDKSNWKSFRFDEIAQNISERVDPNNTVLEVYIGLEHIDSESLHIKRFGTPDDVNGQKLKFYKGDIIFGRRRAYQRKAGIATCDGFCSAHSLVLRANADVIDPDLFPFFMHSDLFMNRAIDISVGSLSPTINWGTLKHQEFLIPNKRDHKELVELLKATDNMVKQSSELREGLRILTEVETLSLLRLSKNSVFPDNWKKLSLKDIAPLQRGFDLPNDKLENGPYPVGYSNGIKKYHSSFQSEGPGVWTGRSGTIGNVFYTDESYWPHNTTLWVTDFKGNHPRYIYHLYSNMRFERKMAGTGVPTLNRNDIHKLSASIPRVDEQILLSDHIDDLLNKLEQAKDHESKTKQVQKSILNKVF